MLWGTLKVQIGRKINDAPLKNADAMMDNANDALRLIASIHTGLASVSSYTGDGETTQFPLPGNCLDSGENRIIGVHDEDNDIWLKEISFIPKRELDTGYYIYPDGYVNFNPYIAEDEVYNVYYVAYYDEIVDDNSSLDQLPKWAIEAVKLYSAGRTLEDLASTMALLGQFRTRVDSGNPEHQPIERLAQNYINQFWDLLNSHHAPQYDIIP